MNRIPHLISKWSLRLGIGGAWDRGLALGLCASIVWLPRPVSAEVFSDQTEGQGVTFQHHVPEVDEMFLGAGAAWGDYDRDGDPDLYVCDQVGPNKLFQNQGNGLGFVDVAVALNVDLPDVQSGGALFGDYDNDGDLDLFVMGWGSNQYFRNDGPGGDGGWIFTEVAGEIDLAGTGTSRTSSAVYGDYDNDGWLDLYVGVHHYGTEKPRESSDSTYRDYLYRNSAGADGQRVFVDVALEIFGETALDSAVAHSCGFIDFDLDSDLDIFVVNEVFSTAPDLSGNQLWLNQGPGIAADWSFAEVVDAGGAYLYSHPMGLAIGDYNNDGWWDMATSDLGPNHLFKNQNGVFSDVAVEAGVAREFVPGQGFEQQFGWGIVFIDYDLDGWEDLYVATGTNPDEVDQFNPLFHNDGNPPDNTFTDVSKASGANLRSSYRCVVRGDYDRDGAPDLYLVSYGGLATLIRNVVNDGDYLALDLVGTASNRDAIGARVTLSDSALPTQYRLVQSGSTTNGGHELTAYFGVTGAEAIDSIRIDWPSGLQSTLSNIAVNQRLTVTEVVPTPAEILITGPSTIASNQTAEFGAVANFDDGSTVTITQEATWSVSPDTYCSFISPGQMSTFNLVSGQSEVVNVTATYESLVSTLSVEVVDSILVDIEAPTIAINVDGGGTSLSTNEDTTVLTGTASDNFELVSMVWSSSNGQSGPCFGLTEWSTRPIALDLGVNEITVTGTDTAGNASNARLTVTYSLPEPAPPPVADINDNQEDDIYGGDDEDPGPVADDNEADPIVADEPNDNASTGPPAPIGNSNVELNDPSLEPAAGSDVESEPELVQGSSGGGSGRGSGGGACGSFGWVILIWSFAGLAFTRWAKRN